MTANVSTNEKAVCAATLVLQQRKIVCDHGWITTARIFDEPWLDLPPIDNPDALVVGLHDYRIGADIFTFAQQLPNIVAQLVIRL